MSDNQSSDEAVIPILESVQGIRGFSVIRRPSNLGANANILLGFLEGKPGSYIWILADDTTLASNSISRVIRCIELGADIIGLHEPDQLVLPNLLKFDPQSFDFVINSTQWGLVSSAIYKFDYLSEDLQQAFVFHNSSFPHLGLLFSAWKRKKDLSVHWARTEEIHDGNMTDLKSDYSLALVGYPHLLFNLERKHRSSRLRIWLRRYSAGFYHNASHHEISSAASFHLVARAGLRARSWLLFGLVEDRLRRSRFGLRMQSFLLKNPDLIAKFAPKNRLKYLIPVQDGRNKVRDK